MAEVVSPDDPPRDLVVKRADYAEAALPEYWIIGPRVETVTVLKLAGANYVEHGVFARGDTATSALLDGLGVDVTALFDEAAGIVLTPIPPGIVRVRYAGSPIVRRISCSASQTRSCSASVSEGYIGSEKISRAACSVSGREPSG